jgi:uncharacterized protein YqgV (UPF0045/DUF77 family)
VSALAAFSITPLGPEAADGDGSVGAAVASVVRLVRDSGLANETNAMFTNVEGSLPEVMDLIQRCIEHAGTIAPRVSVVVKLDVRQGVDDALHSKVETVERHLAGS